MLEQEHIEISDPAAFWIRMCHRIQANAEKVSRTGEGECLGFDVITNGKGQTRILDSTTQIPMTGWEPSYTDALEQLDSCRLVAK